MEVKKLARRSSHFANYGNACFCADTPVSVGVRTNVSCRHWERLCTNYLITVCLTGFHLTMRDRISVCVHLEDRSSHLLDAWWMFAGIQGKCCDDLQTPLWAEAAAEVHGSVDRVELLLLYELIAVTGVCVCVYCCSAILNLIKSVLLDKHVTQCQTQSFIHSSSTTGQVASSHSHLWLMTQPNLTQREHANCTQKDRGLSVICSWHYWSSQAAI